MEAVSPHQKLTVQSSLYSLSYNIDYTEYHSEFDVSSLHILEYFIEGCVIGSSEFVKVDLLLAYATGQYDET